MENKTLFKLSFMVSLIGLFSLLILAKFSEPNKWTIPDLNQNYKNYLDQEVSVRGFISSLKQFDSGEVILNIRDLNSSIQCRGSFSQVGIKENDYCEIIGTLREYNSSHYIEIKSIKKA